MSGKEIKLGHTMKNLNLLFVCTFVFSLTSFARSGGIGNGGDAVVCKDYVTLLDSYEASVKYELTINLDNKNVDKQSLRSYVLTAVDRLSLRDKYTAKKLYDYAMEMVTDFENFEMFSPNAERYRGKVIYIGPDSVGEISDSRHRTVPEGCELRQLVSQKTPQRLRENRYEINMTLWKKLSLVDQAMTILHEAWYRIMLEDGAKDSEGTRYMNGLIASEEFDSYSFASYLKELKSTEKKYYIIENNSSLVFDKVFKVNLKSKITFEKDSACTNSVTVRANIKRLRMITSWHRGLAKTNFSNVCFNDSVMKSLTLPNKLASKRINFVMDNYLLRANKLIDKKATIYFNDNGTFKEVTGLKFEALYKMNYKCKSDDGEYVSDERGENCKGPYLIHDSKVKNPENVIFDSKETPIGFF